MGPFPPNNVGKIAQHDKKGEGRKEGKDGWANLYLLPWPRSSPEMSLIENVWHMIGHGRHGPPTNILDSFWTRKETTWERLPGTYPGPLWFHATTLKRHWLQRKGTSHQNEISLSKIMWWLVIVMLLVSKSLLVEEDAFEAFHYYGFHLSYSFLM